MDSHSVSNYFISSVVATKLCILQLRWNDFNLFQVEKQFDALLVDTSAPVFDTTSSDTTDVSRD